MAVEGFSVEVDGDPERVGAGSATGSAGTATVVTVAGDVDLAAADTLWSVLDEYVRPGVSVIVDCSKVAFLDSMGLRTLIRAQHKADAAGARLTLAAPSEAVLRVLTLAGVSELFVLDLTGSGGS
jgi:anti-sigma B factor antagonist